MSKKEVISLRREKWENEILSGEQKEYVKSEAEKVEEYGFFIRFIHEHFRPCTKCQLEIKTILVTQDMHYHRERQHISLLQDVTDGKKTFSFGMPFVRNGLDLFTWDPCPECQKKLAKLFDETESITIGNKEYAEPVELYMKFYFNDKSWKEVEHRPSTPEEQERLKNSWFD